MSRWRVARLEDVPVTDDGRVPFRAVRHHLGIGAFGVNAFVSRGAGEPALNEHDEADTGDEELYLVLSGHAVFTVDGEEVDGPPGTLLLVDPASRRSAVAREDGTTILALGARPGQAYRPGGWELWAPANQPFQAGDYERVIELLTPVVAEHPEYPVLAYNLACAESLAGRRAEAIDHLRQAIAADETFREYAHGDSDLDAIRDDPAFADLVARNA